MSAFLGLDFGTESVRALLVDGTGATLGAGIVPYEHGQIVRGTPVAAQLFADALPAAYALQHPGDWLPAAADAVRQAVAGADPAIVDGIGVAFTSCTVLPADADGVPLALLSSHGDRPHAWPKLWKHHAAVAQTARINEVARGRDEPWLPRYGGVVGLEWFFPKLLEVIDEDPGIAEAIALWIEAGDWVVGRLTGMTGDPTRSTCQAGYKAMWSRADGYPSAAFLGACHPTLADVASRALPGTFRAPGEAAGGLASALAAEFGIRPGIPVSTATIDAHAGVPGAGVSEPGTLVMVLGTSGCHMVMDAQEHLVAGVAGVVADGILPGSYGYETGQAAVGDAFDWVRRLTGRSDFVDLACDAAALRPGSDGLLAVDWFNGCRTPLMDGSLTGAILGVQLHHGAAHLFRSVMEASACGIRWIVETLRDGGVAVDRFVATGGLAHASPIFGQIVADVLGDRIEIHRADHGPALGAAVLGAVAAEGFDDVGAAVSAMAGDASAIPDNRLIDPDPAAAAAYHGIYARYRAAAGELLARSDRAEP